MRLRRGDAAGQALQAGVAFQLLAQLVNVQRSAHAAMVQGVGDAHSGQAFNKYGIAWHRARRKLVLDSNAR